VTGFRNNGLNVRLLAPITLSVEAVNRGLNRAAIPARAGSETCLPMAWNITLVSDVTWVRNCPL